MGRTRPRTGTKPNTNASWQPWCCQLAGSLWQRLRVAMVAAMALIGIGVSHVRCAVALAKGELHELIVTTASAPTSQRRDALFAVESFANHRTFRCRLLNDASVICALYNSSDGKAVGGGRVAKLSWFEKAGSKVEGPAPTPFDRGMFGRPATMYTYFNVTFSKNSFTVILNDERVLEVSAIPRSLTMPTKTAYAYAGVTARSESVETSVKQVG